MLLQNAPTVVSVDAVLTRSQKWKFVFAKVEELETVKTSLLNEWKHKIATQEAQSDHLFTVVNTALHDKVDTVSVVVNVDTCDFKSYIQLKVTRRWQP